MPGPPPGHSFAQRRRVGGRIAAVREVEVEVVSEAGQSLLRQVVDEPIRGAGPDVHDSVRRRIVEVGAEAVEPDGAASLRRAEVPDGVDRRGARCVVGRLLARDAVEDVPARLDPELLAPFQELHVLGRAHPLVDEPEHAAAEALDARLELPDPGPGQQLQLGLREVRLRLVEDAHRVLQLGEAWDEVAEVAHVEDLVGHHEGPRVVGVAQGEQLGERPLRALRAVFRRKVDPAEAAVVLVPPPATTGRLHRDDPAVRAAALLEELVEVRIRQLVEVVHALRGHARANAVTRAAGDDTGDLRRIAPVPKGRQQMPET